MWCRIANIIGRGVELFDQEICRVSPIVLGLVMALGTVVEKGFGVDAAATVVGTGTVVWMLSKAGRCLGSALAKENRNEDTFRALQSSQGALGERIGTGLAFVVIGAVGKKAKEKLLPPLEKKFKSLKSQYWTKQTVQFKYVNFFNRIIRQS